MKKQLILLMVISIFLLSLVGGVSATDTNTTANIEIDLNYEYKTDTINPEISVVSNNDSIDFVKKYNSSSNNYILDLNDSNAVSGKEYNVSVSATGYDTLIKDIILTNNGSKLFGNIIFNMKATESYKLGMDVTAKADSLLDFAKADDVLTITSAGVPKINGKTSEDAIEGILNQAKGTITYGQGNLLLLRQTAVDPVDFCFIVRKGNSLMAAIFLNGSTELKYYGTISDDMSREQWNKLVNAIGGENAFAFASLGNGWKSGVSKDVLQEAAFHGHICDGTLGGYSITQALLSYYPPIQETSGGSGSPGDITSYKILGVPGDSDDDAVLFFLDGTPGKSAYIGYDTTATGARKDMIAFIRWQDAVIKYNPVTNKYEIIKPGTGTLILMSFNSLANKEAFKIETGIDPNAGSLEELKYQDWWINKINTNPGSLVKIIYELDNLTEEQYYYFIGTASNITYPTTVKNATNAGEVIIPATEAHGLDYAYITNLSKILPSAIRSNTTSISGNLSYNQIKEIGKNASEQAKEIFKNELGIDIEFDDPNFVVLTSGGYVYLNGQTTEAVKDGVNEVFGSTLSSKTLLPIHVAVWKPLWFTFVLKVESTGELLSVFIRYNPNGTYFIGDVDGKKVNDIGINALNNASMVSKLSTTFIPDNWFNIQSITNAWNGDPEFDQLITFLFHDHACPGVQPGFFITDYIQSNYPLNENENYNYIASSIYCKDDSLVYLLGISPGMEDYFNQRLPDEETESTYIDGATEEGVLIIWDNKLNIGRAVIINFKWATIDTSQYKTSEAKRASQIQAYIDMYARRENPIVKEGVTVKATAENWITAEQFQILKSGSGDSNALRYLESLPTQTKEDLLKSMNQNSGDANGTVISDNGGSSSSSSGFSSSSESSVGSNEGYSGVSSSSSDSSSSDSVDIGSVSAASTPASGSQGKASEISKNSQNSNGINTNNIIYAALAILIIGGLFGFGYMRTKKH